VVLVNSDRIDKLGVVTHRSIAVRGVIDGIHRLALRNKSIGNLMRQLPSDILGVNRREWIWKSHEARRGFNVCCRLATVSRL
jgi:hypothetical protein